MLIFFFLNQSLSLKIIVVVTMKGFLMPVLEYVSSS